MVEQEPRDRPRNAEEIRSEPGPWKSSCPKHRSIPLPQGGQRARQHPGESPESAQAPPSGEKNPELRAGGSGCWLPWPGPHPAAGGVSGTPAHVCTASPHPPGTTPRNMATPQEQSLNTGLHSYCLKLGTKDLGRRNVTTLFRPHGYLQSPQDNAVIHFHRQTKRGPIPRSTATAWGTLGPGP